MDLTDKVGMSLETVTLGTGGAVAVIERERERLQSEELRRIVAEVLHMFRRLSDELVMDRRGALSLMAEMGGLLEEKLQRVNGLRGGGLPWEDRKWRGVAEQLERLECGLSFLVGFLGVIETTERTWPLDRTEIKSSLLKVWPILEGLQKRLGAKCSEIDLNKCSLV